MSIFKRLFFKDQPFPDADAATASDTFCIMPWVHLHVTQHGTVTPCCQAPWEREEAFGDINEEAIGEIWKGNEVRTFRKKMLTGKRDTRCNRCYEKEASGFSSLRQITNQKFAEHIPAALSAGEHATGTPIYWDIRFSNVCNLKCRICGPWSSSQWHTDAIALGMKGAEEPVLTQAAEQPEALMAQLREMAEGLEEIYFAGGEPLIMAEHYELLDLLLSLGKTDVRLQYNTNFSKLTFKDRDVVELWKRFSHVTVSASLDGMDSRGELQRSLQKWPQVLANMQRLRTEAPHVQVILSPTLSVFNLFHLPDFHRDWTERGLIRPETFFPSLLIQPEAYNIRLLPLPLKEKAEELYTNHLTWLERQNAENVEQMAYCKARFQEAVSHLKSGDHSHLIPAFLEKCEALDRLRGEDTKATFPELEMLWER